MASKKDSRLVGKYGDRGDLVLELLSTTFGGVKEGVICSVVAGGIF
jgi:hypothetical protein